jgi:hypothetical protein
MALPPISDETCELAAKCLRDANGNQAEAARLAGDIPRSTFQNWVIQASRRGKLGFQPVLPGYIAKTISTKHNADGEVTSYTVAQGLDRPDAPPFPDGFALKRMTVHRSGDGKLIQEWASAEPSAEETAASMRAVVDALKEEIPHAAPVPAPLPGNADLLNQFTVTDVHLGSLCWREESGADYDLKIAEQLLMDWFGAAISMAPNAQTAILAQLGDLLHHDSHLSVTPTHAHVLDADSRLQKMIRVAIRAMRRIVAMLLAKHERVHIIMADANHDPAGGAWLREMFAAFFEDEPRVTVDSSASTYYVYEHGETSLFYHHGHRRKIDTVDSVFAGQFRQAYGRTKHSYAHIGHLHSDALKSTNLMKVERHETLAAPDAYAANGGWLADRSAKVITYHRKFGEVSRCIISPQMLAGA